MKVLALCKYGRKGASSRLRTMQYLEPLLSEGIKLDVHCLLGDDYLEAKYAGKTAASSVASSYVKRAMKLGQSKSYDLIHLEKEAFPWLPWVLEKSMLSTSVPLSLDLDDAIFHLYDSHRNANVRRLLGNKIDRVMRRSSLVTTGSRYIQERAHAAGAPRVEYLPTVVDSERYIPRSPNFTGSVTIGWIGSPSTTKYLKLAAEPLLKLAGLYSLDFVAVGADPAELAGTPFRAVEWSEEGEAALVSSFDIGIMPLEQTRWERGKCAYKIIQYMASGVPVVASPVGMNVEVLERSRCGSLAGSDDQWYLELERLIRDPELRMEVGRCGRTAVEDFYSVQAQAPQLAEIWRQVVGLTQGRPRREA